MQLALAPRQLVILGLLLAAERMPLYRTQQYGNKREMHFDGGSRPSPSVGARKTAHHATHVTPGLNFEPTPQKNENGQLWCSSQNLFCGRCRRASSRHRSNQYSFRSGVGNTSTVTRRLQYTEHRGERRVAGCAPLARGDGSSRFSSTGSTGRALTQWSNTHTRTLTYRDGARVLVGIKPVSSC